MEHVGEEDPSVVAARSWGVRAGLMERPADDLLVRFRHTPVASVVIWGLAAFCVGAGIRNIARHDWSLSNTASIALLFVMGATWVLFAFGSVDLYPDRLVMNGPIRRRVEVPLADVRGITNSRYGLRVHSGRRRINSGPMLLGASTIRGLFGISDQGSRIEEQVMEAASMARQAREADVPS